MYYIFPVKVQGEDILKYVFPTKQKDVQKIIEIAKGEKAIREVILFGSSITKNCSFNSDIDIALLIEGDTSVFYQIERKIRKAVSSEIDIINYGEIEDPSFKENVDKGVKIYEHRV